MLTVADDSGLAIDALDGQPGIHSARFAQGDFNTAMTKLLNQLKAVKKDDRTAQFISVLALYDPNTKKIITFTGKAHGWITDKQGKKGFGYDPIFFSKKLKKTFGQASDQEKNKISHRAQTLKKLLVYLSKLEIHEK